MDLNIGAERTAVLKAVSEGEIRFRSLAMASDTSQAFPSPDGPGRQFLAEFGDFPVYLVNRDLQARRRIMVLPRLLLYVCVPKPSFPSTELVPRSMPAPVL